MNTKDNNLDALDRATAWLERTEDLTLDDLRSVRHQMGEDVETSERDFLKFIKEIKTVTAPAPFALLSRAKQLGLSKVNLADATELSVPLIMKLDRRMIQFSTIPELVVRKVGEVLAAPIELVRVYLQQQPAFATGANFRADEAPRLPEAQNFFDAVSEDLTISEARKKSLLALKP